MTITALTLNKGIRLVIAPRRSFLSVLAQRFQAFRVWLSRAICGLTGHERFLHRTDGRLCLRCWYCGDESTGWETGRVPRARRMPVVSRQPAARRMPAVSRQSAA